HGVDSAFAFVSPPLTGTISFCAGSRISIGLSVTAARSLADDASLFLPVTTLSKRAPRARAASCIVALSVAVWAMFAGLTRTAIVEAGDIRLYISSKVSNASDVAARAREARDETNSDRIRTDSKNVRDCLSRRSLRPLDGLAC